MNEEELHQLEVELIKKYNSVLGKVKSRPIKLIEFNDDTLGRATKRFLLLNRKHLNKDSKEEVTSTICHELNHYATSMEGHNSKFLENMRLMGYENTYYEANCWHKEGQFKGIIQEKLSDNIVNVSEVSQNFLTAW